MHVKSELLILRIDFIHLPSTMVSFPGTGVGPSFACCFGVDGLLYTLEGFDDLMVWMSTPSAAVFMLCDLLKSRMSVEFDLYFFSFSFNSSNSLD